MQKVFLSEQSNIDTTQGAWLIGLDRKAHWIWTDESFCTL